MNTPQLVRPCPATAASLILAALTSTASAQWNIVVLQPADAGGSWATGIGAGQQAGNVTVGGVNHAALWRGIASSWVDLSPAGATQSYASGTDAHHQVGDTYVGGTAFNYSRASLWTGTAGSWVDLNPAGATFSHAYGVGGGQQAGAAVFGALHAGFWTGTAASWIDLHPAGAFFSQANGASGGQQVGVVFDNGREHATLWTSSVASMVDLDPAGATWSEAWGVGDGQQVGYATLEDEIDHASLWTGSAESWVDLNPAGADGSVATAADGGQQAGIAFFYSTGQGGHAGIWSGTAASWVDLHAFIPPGFTQSFARGIWHDGSVTYVVGNAYDDATGHSEALMWILDPCSPHPWTGVLPPISPDGRSAFRLGSTVPVKFRLTGECDSDPTLVARLYVAPVTAGTVGAEQEAVPTSNANSGDRFRYSDGQYVFNLSTRGLAAGTWRLRIDLGDGVERTVLILLRS